jgi:hypothetical protein
MAVDTFMVNVRICPESTRRTDGQPTGSSLRWVVAAGLALRAG